MPAETTIELPPIQISIVRPPVPRAEEIAAPSDAPRLHVSGVSFGGHTLGVFSDRRNGEWPKDAHRLELYVAFVRGGGREPAPLAKAWYWRSVMEKTVDVRFNEEADGVSVTYYGRWVNERGDRGPWGEPVCKTIVT